MDLSKWVFGLVMFGLITTSRVNALSCGDAVSALIPCGSYLLGAEVNPSPNCCKSAQSLNNLASDTKSRRAVCECFKQSGPSFGVKPERAKLLPSLCKLNINLAITPNVNCTDIK